MKELTPSVAGRNGGSGEIFQDYFRSSYRRDYARTLNRARTHIIGHATARVRMKTSAPRGGGDVGFSR